MRSNSGRAVKVFGRYSAKGRNSNTKNNGEAKSRIAERHKKSYNEYHTAPEPLVALINQIGRDDRTAEVQEIVRKLKARPHPPHNPTQSLPGRIPIQINTPPAQIIQAIPSLAGEIENSTINEQLSRVYNRIALADFYCAYRAAQDNPNEFLQGLDRSQSQHTDQFQMRKQTKRAEVKARFVQLVFCRLKGERNWKKDSACINNWQSWGKPWFELINRFGRGFLLLVPREMTNRRQV